MVARLDMVVIYNKAHNALWFFNHMVFYISIYSRPMAIKHDKKMTWWNWWQWWNSTHKLRKTFMQVIMWGHVKDLKNIFPLSQSLLPLNTLTSRRRFRMQAPIMQLSSSSFSLQYLWMNRESVFLHFSSIDPIIWLRDYKITWQISNILSSLPECLWLQNLAGW